MTCLICFYFHRLELSAALLGWLRLCGLRGWSLIGIRTEPRSVWTTVPEAKGTRNADEAFVEAFEEPIRVCLRDRSIRHSLLDARAHFSCVCRLDGVLHS